MLPYRFNEYEGDNAMKDKYINELKLLGKKNLPSFKQRSMQDCLDVYWHHMLGRHDPGTAPFKTVYSRFEVYLKNRFKTRLEALAIEKSMQTRIYGAQEFPNIAKANRTHRRIIQPTLVQSYNKKRKSQKSLLGDAKKMKTDSDVTVEVEEIQFNSIVVKDDNNKKKDRYVAARSSKRIENLIEKLETREKL